jgi:hypothetical protein
VAVLHKAGDAALGQGHYHNTDQRKGENQHYFYHYDQ